MAHGFVPKIVLSYLPERLPRTLALDLVLSARSITGEEALALGLVTRVAAPGELRDDAAEYARTLVEDGRAALLRDAKAYAARMLAEPPAERPRIALEESLRSMKPRTDLTT
jgi:enoyl-CoA hydratase/carnithine racemase